MADADTGEAPDAEQAYVDLGFADDQDTVHPGESGSFGSDGQIDLDAA
jgi:hypothetical protein